MRQPIRIKDSFDNIDEYYEWVRDTQSVVELIKRTARKIHQCDGCEREIRPGEKYWNRQVKIRGSRARPYRNEHRCLKCGEPEPDLRVVK